MQLGVDNLPEQVEPEMLVDDDFLRKFHHALLEVWHFKFRKIKVCFPAGNGCGLMVRA